MPINGPSGSFSADALCEAASKRDLEKVKDELSKPEANPNTPDSNGILAIIAVFGDPSCPPSDDYTTSLVIQELLDAGADISANDGELRTALNYAVEKKFLRTISLLVAAGADPMKRVDEENSLSPMEFAECIYDRYLKSLIVSSLKGQKIPEKIILERERVDKDNIERKLLDKYNLKESLAKKQENEAVIDLLANELESAIKSRDVHLVQDLLHKNQVNMKALKQFHVSNLLWMATARVSGALDDQVNASLEILALLLNSGLNPNAKFWVKQDMKYPAPVVFLCFTGLCKAGAIKSLELLIQAGLDVNAQDPCEEISLIQKAVNCKLMPIVLRLAEEGADTSNLTIPSGKDYLKYLNEIDQENEHYELSQKLIKIIEFNKNKKSIKPSLR